MRGKLRAVAVIICLLTTALPLFADEHTDAAEIVKTSLEKMGGVERFEDLKAISSEMLITGFLNEQSESPDVEPLINHLYRTEVRDYKSGRMVRTRQMMGMFTQSAEWSPALTIIYEDSLAYAERGEQKFAWNPSGPTEAKIQSMLYPEQALAGALKADDTKLKGTEEFQGVPHYVITYSRDGHKIILKINAGSKLLSSAETVAAMPRDVFWQGWGDLRFQIQYSNWWRYPAGFLYPAKWDEFRGDWHVAAYTFIDVQLDPGLEDFPAPLTAEERSRLEAQLSMRDIVNGGPRENEELAPGIVQLRGAWNAALIEQEDGIVVLESPISPAFSEKIIAEAKKRFPSKKIKAVISTSDAWPHFNGMRQYVAEGVPVYILDLNQKIVNKLISSRHSLAPDALEKSPKKAKLNLVNSATAIGSGANRLIVAPVHGEGGERMMLAYFPEHKLLYGTDLIQQNRDGSFFSLQYVAEVVDAAEREGFSPESVFNMHTGPLPWSTILEALKPEGAEAGSAN